jgi:hypothetical protein
MKFCETKCSQCKCNRGYENDLATGEVQYIECYLDHTRVRDTRPFYRKIDFDNAVLCRMFEMSEEQPKNLPLFQNAVGIFSHACSF